MSRRAPQEKETSGSSSRGREVRGEGRDSKSKDEEKESHTSRRDV